MMAQKSRLLSGAILLLLGAALVATNYRVLATFLLDVVVRTISADPGPPLEPYDFSWGTMHWGRTPAEFSTLCTGFFLIAIGQAFVLPEVIRRIGSAAPETPRVFPKLMMVGASVLTLVAAGSFLLIPLTTKIAFSTIVVSGGVDPVSLAEDLPIRASQVFMIALVGAQVLILVVAFTAPNSGPLLTSGVGKVLSIAAGAFLFLFAVLMAVTRLGPVRVFADLGSPGGLADPAELAGQISLALNMILFGSPLLAAAAILTGVAVLIPASRSHHSQDSTAVGGRA